MGILKVFTSHGEATLECDAKEIDAESFRALVLYLPPVGAAITHLSEQTFPSRNAALEYASTWASELYRTG